MRETRKDVKKILYDSTFTKVDPKLIQIIIYILDQPFIKVEQYLGYQAVNKSLQWLRIELGYGKNPPYDTNVNTLVEIDNPQPSL